MSLRALQGPTGGGAPVGGTGTTNTIPRWTGASTLGDSVITQSGSFIGIGLGAAAPLATVHTLNAVGAIGASPNWMSSFDTSGNYRSGLAFAFSVTPSASKVAVQVSSNGTGGVVNALVAQGDGNVGIGTASPGFKFVVADTVAGVVTSEVRNDSTNSAATARLRFTTQGGESWIEAFRNAGGALTFATLSTERARIDSSGNFILNTATTGATIQAAGSQQGLKLPATPGNADAQTLDCYSEPTWTPTDASGAGLAFTVNRATYTKVGRTVTATLDVQYPVTANASAAKINLPESTSTQNIGAVVVGYCSVAAVGLTGIIENGKLDFYYGSPSAAVPNSALSNARIVLSVSFNV